MTGRMKGGVKGAQPSGSLFSDTTVRHGSFVAGNSLRRASATARNDQSERVRKDFDNSIETMIVGAAKAALERDSVRMRPA
jgi:hypothetical protein